MDLCEVEVQLDCLKGNAENLVGSNKYFQFCGLKLKYAEGTSKHPHTSWSCAQQCGVV